MCNTSSTPKRAHGQLAPAAGRRAAVHAGALAAALALGLAGPAAAASTAELYRESYAAEARGDIATALATLDEIPEGARDYVCSLRRGWLYYLALRHDDAVKAYQRAAQLEPRAAEPRLGLMLPLMALRRWADAEKAGLAVLALAPGELLATSRIAYIHYNQGRFGDAETYYRRALALHPAQVELRAGLGWSLLKQGKVKDARAELGRVLAVAPDHASAKEGLALLP